MYFRDKRSLVCKKNKQEGKEYKKRSKKRTAKLLFSARFNRRGDSSCAPGIKSGGQATPFPDRAPAVFSRLGSGSGGREPFSGNSLLCGEGAGRRRRGGRAGRLREAVLRAGTGSFAAIFCPTKQPICGGSQPGPHWRFVPGSGQ